MQAFKAGRVFDGQCLLPQGSALLIDEGRILEVLARGTSVPESCSVAEFPTATLLPGLIDAHVHLCADSGPGALERLQVFTDGGWLASSRPL